MAKKVICQGCRKKFDRDIESFVKTSKGYYHSDCAPKKQSKEKSGRTLLFEALELATPGKVNYPLVAKQFKEFTENYSYTESGLLGTFYYITEIKQMPVIPSKGIAILPFFYGEAREYNQKIRKLKDNIQEGITNEEKVIKINITPPKNKRILDLEEIFKEDNNG